MKSLVVAQFVSIALVLAADPLAGAQQKEQPYRPPQDKGMYGSGPGDMRPRAPKVEKEEEPVTTPMDDQWKLLLAVVVIALVGYTAWRFLSESAKVKPPSARKPWEIE